MLCLLFSYDLHTCRPAACGACRNGGGGYRDAYDALRGGRDSHRTAAEAMEGLPQQGELGEEETDEREEVGQRLGKAGKNKQQAEEPGDDDSAGSPPRGRDALSPDFDDDFD